MPPSSNISEAVDLLLQEGYYASSYNPDPEDPRRKEGYKEFQGEYSPDRLSHLLYIRRDGFGFSNKNPSDIATFTNIEKEKMYFETLVVESNNQEKTQISYSGYITKIDNPLLRRLQQSRKQTFSQVKETLAALEQKLVQAPEGFLIETFNGAYTPEEIKAFVITIFDLKPRNR